MYLKVVHLELQTHTQDKYEFRDKHSSLFIFDAKYMEFDMHDWAFTILQIDNSQKQMPWKLSTSLIA